MAGQQQEHSRELYQMPTGGMCLNSTPEGVPKGKARYVKNLRSYSADQLEPRYGLVALNSTAIPDPIHTIKRINDDTEGLYSLILGAGTKLYSTQFITGATNVNPIVITTDRPHNAKTGDTVYISGVLGNTAANGTRTIIVITTTTFSIGVAGNGAYSSGGFIIFLRDTGYSGSPLQIVIDRPDRSPKPYAYIADTQRLRKINVDGLCVPWGVAPPIIPPAVALGGISYKVISQFDAVSDGGVNWTPGGTAGAITALSDSPATIIGGTNATPIVLQTSAAHPFIDGDYINIAGIVGLTAANGDWQVTIPDNTHITLLTSIGNSAWVSGGTATRYQYTGTINAIVYDSGSSGFASIAPSIGGPGLQPNELIVINTGGGSAETVLIEQLFNPIANTTIQNISFDSGASGSCSITLAATSAGLVPNALIRLGGATETVRIQSVAFGPDGLPSIRVITASTHAIGDAVTGLISFRASCINSHSVAETLRDNGLQSSITVGTGYIQHLKAIDLSNVNGRAITNDDIITFLFRMDAPQNLSEGRVMFDLDTAIQDAAHNLLYKPFRPSDLQSVFTSPATGTTVDFRQTFITRDFLDTPQQGPFIQDQQLVKPDKFLLINGGDDSSGTPTDPFVNFTPAPVSDQASTGPNQLTALTFKVSDLTQIGSDQTRSLRDVQSIRIQLTTTGTVVLTCIDLWIGGTFGPDIGDQGAGFSYRHVWRSSATGAQSNPSPSTRVALQAHRQIINGIVTTPDTRAATGDPQIDFGDVYRIGGSLTDWAYVLSVAIPVNSAPSTVNFQDVYPDDNLNTNRLLDFDNFQPFPLSDLPRSGTCDVVGTIVKRRSGGDSFNTSWAPYDGPVVGQAFGTLIQINGVTYPLYSSPTDANTLEIAFSAGNQSNVAWQIFEPILLGQPLPAIWGPFGGGEEGEVIFACGTNLNKGTFYWTRFSTPDSASNSSFLEVTSPSEPFIGGYLWDGRPYIGSSERQFEIIPTFGLGTSDFICREIINSKGLLSRHQIAVAREVFTGARDGLYSQSGGIPTSITDLDLYPIFPTEANIGTPVVLIADPDNPLSFSAPDFTQLDSLRLSYYMDFLYLDYKGQDANRHTLVMDNSEGRGETANQTGAKWFYDEYKVGILCHYGEEGNAATANRLLMGSSNGKIYVFSGTQDDGQSFDCALITASENQGSQRLVKEYGDLAIDLNTTALDVNLTILQDRTLNSFPMTQPINNFERNIEVIDFDATAFASIQRLANDIALYFTWTNAGHPILYTWQLTFLTRAEQSLLRPTEFSDGGKQQNKYVYGCTIWADTGAADRKINIIYNGVTVGPQLVCRHEGWQPVTYTFEPFYARDIRLAPDSTDKNEWMFGNVQWLFSDASDFVSLRRTQESTYGLSGYSYFREAQILYQSSAPVTYTRTIDGVTQVYTLPNTNGQFVKQYFPLMARKGKVYIERLESNAPFYVDADGLELRGNSWGRVHPYTGSPAIMEAVSPFGAATQPGASL